MKQTNKLDGLKNKISITSNHKIIIFLYMINQSKYLNFIKRYCTSVKMRWNEGNADLVYISRTYCLSSIKSINAILKCIIEYVMRFFFCVLLPKGHLKHCTNQSTTCHNTQIIIVINSNNKKNNNNNIAITNTLI